jgi:DHA1 family bicyclomycin/chloramphenicol resistance-like MFS transporter
MTGAAVMAVVGLFVDGTARPMLVGVAGAALVSLMLTFKTLGRQTAKGSAPA